jgi:hypothetical protein
MRASRKSSHSIGVKLTVISGRFEFRSLNVSFERLISRQVLVSQSELFRQLAADLWCGTFSLLPESISEAYSYPKNAD